MWNPGVLVLLAVFATALFGCIALVMTQRWHGWLSLDHDLSGVQKIHRRPVPRVGGIAVFSALLVGGLGALWIDEPLAPQILGLLFCSLPAFLAGLIEDLTKRVGVRARLYASFASAALAGWIMDALLDRLSTPGLDYLIAFAPISVLFTCFAVGGLTNAVNIIDGINGLAAGSVILMLSGLGAMAWINQDILVFEMCLIGIAALTGFMVLNFPGGRIFLGDGGAYLAGFWLAECAVLLLVRNPAVSTWSVLLACVYPVWETVFSIFRRQVISRASSGEADQVHLHHILLTRLRANRQSGTKGPPTWKSHSLVSMFIWLMVAGCQVIALTVGANTAVLACGVIAFAGIYSWIYQALSSGANLEPQSIQAAKI